MLIKQIDRDTEKERIARLILESLPEWFGIPQAREEYIAHSRGKPFFCAFEAERPVGFLYLKETGRHTVEVAVMGKGKSQTDGILFHPGQNCPDGAVRYLR